MSRPHPPLHSVSPNLDGRPRLRVLTLNLHKGFSAWGRRDVLQQIRAAVHDVGADLVFLQEVLGEVPELVGLDGTRRHRSQYEFLADSLWAEHAYGRNAVSPRGHHGNALLSRWPIVSWRNLDVSAQRAEARGLLHCCVQIPGWTHRLHAICVHLGLREAERQAQIGQLIQLVDQARMNQEPVLVAGDFNDWRLLGHRRLQRDSALRDVHGHAMGRPVRTFPAQLPLLRLDRIYVDQVQWHAPERLPAQPWAKLSDHQPLLAEVVL
jgi:endonuclease/exonuclease/phosphatase family metal-dependent hydrolase